MDGQQAFERSLPYQFRQLLNEIDAIATPGAKLVLWRMVHANRHSRPERSVAPYATQGEHYQARLRSASSKQRVERFTR